MLNLEELSSQGLVQNHKIPAHSASIGSRGREMPAGEQSIQDVQCSSSLVSFSSRGSGLPFRHLGSCFCLN